MTNTTMELLFVLLALLISSASSAGQGVLLSDVVSEFSGIIGKLRGRANAKTAKQLLADYGSSNGAQYLGVTNEKVARMSEEFSKKHPFSLPHTLDLMESPTVEERLLAIYLLRNAFDKGSDEVQQNVVNEYVRSIPSRVTNPNLADVGSATIVGKYVARSRDRIPLLYKLAAGESVWERRTALMSTLPVLERHFYEPTDKITSMLYNDPDEGIRRISGRVLGIAGSLSEFFWRDYITKHANKISWEAFRSAANMLPPDSVARSVEFVSVRFKDQLRDDEEYHDQQRSRVRK